MSLGSENQRYLCVVTTNTALEESQPGASLSGNDQHCIGGKSISRKSISSIYLLVVETNTAIRKVARTNTASQEGQPGTIMRAQHSFRMSVRDGNRQHCERGSGDL